MPTRPKTRWLLLTVLLAMCCACRRTHPLRPYIAYVVNHDSASLAEVNLAEFRVTGFVPIAANAERVVVRPHTHHLYVVSATGKITVAAYPRLRVVAMIDVGRSARDLVFSPDGRAAYVLDPVDQEIVFLDFRHASSAHLEEAIPRPSFRVHQEGTLNDLALSPDGNTLVVASASPGLLTFYDSATRRRLGSLPVGHAPGPMSMLPNGSKLFVADTGEEKISVADVASRKVLVHLEIASRPTNLLMKPDGGELFIFAAPASNLIIADAYHDDVEQTFPLGSQPVAGVFRRDMSVLYIANAGDGSVLALDVQNRQVLAVAHVGVEPHALALTPDERLLVVADRAASSLAIVAADPTSLNERRSLLITTVPVGASPVDVVVPDVVPPRTPPHP